MLTKNDLQQIRIVVKEEVEIVDKKLDKAQEDISEILTTIIEHHDSLEKRFGDIEEHINLPRPQ